MNIKSIFLSLFLFALFFALGLFTTASLRHNAVSDKPINSFLIAQPQGRNCILNGKEFPDGAIVGGLVCRDGTWKPR